MQTCFFTDKRFGVCGTAKLCFAGTRFLGKKTVGRIRTKQIKRLGQQFIDTHKSELAKNFKENKQKVQELSDVKSKKLRNMIAGYLTKRMKKSEE